MGSCCLVTKTKDNFKGYRFIKDDKKNFRLEKIDNSERPIRKKTLKITSSKLKKNNSTTEISNSKISHSKTLNSIYNKKEQNKKETISKIKTNNNLKNEKNEYYSQKDFIKGKIKGKGRFGIVYSGLYSKSGEIVAIKIYDNVNEKSRNEIFNNIKELYYLNHPNLIKAIPLVDTLQINKIKNKETFTIIYEISNGNSLKELINQFGELDEIIIQKYSKDILLALQYLHNKNIIHKNIKTSNILVDSNGTIKISDSLIDSIILGNGKELYDKLLNKEINLENNKIDYSIPPFFIQNIKINQNYIINQSYDLWCLGCVLIECLSGNAPWSHYPFKNQRDFIKFLSNTHLIPTLPKKLSNQCKEFLNLLFDYNQTSKNDIYEKLYNLDFFKINYDNKSISNNLSGINNESIDKSSMKSSIIFNNIFNITTIKKKNKNNNNINNNNKNNLGQVLKNLQIVNVLNNNDSPTFSITISGISSNRNSFYNQINNQSNKSSFLNGSCIIKKYGLNNNNLNNLKNFEMFEVPEANIEQSPITIKDNNMNIYNFECNSKNDDNKNFIENCSVLESSQLNVEINENDNEE